MAEYWVWQGDAATGLERYEQRYGRRPGSVYVHPGELPEDVAAVELATVPAGYVWMERPATVGAQTPPPPPAPAPPLPFAVPMAAGEWQSTIWDHGVDDE